ncbi:chemotaxis protein CheW [Devosia sp.]|uniref:chemotaxis protein CheW n=1 Tax=Devosia sp. TaxID=1871048 RepID=UPI003A8D5373
MSTLGIEVENRSNLSGHSAPEDQFITFASDGVDYGVGIMAVREIRSWQPTTPLPKRGSAAKGVLDVRGTVVEVFELAGLLGGQTREPTAGSVVLVLALDDRTIGLLVDSVSDIIQAPAEEMMSVPKQGAHSTEPVGFMVSTGERMVGILDLNALFPKQAG